ncbi:hypothetical protein RBS60_01275 [Sinomonas sp. ASV486]|uniref:hypothetical protein n=1 Tax=Sinomonas sp. ASV486 TaxID=3051170 RepID=UPI0027DC54D1|nr:hypothetical protein [Sinomonas sp. ASV486]MDQ4488823.1 hypothetical protein [Sinomonas sp. ASV486]
MTETRTNNMPSRRAVTKAAAWSAPVIAAAVAAPMAAASGQNGQQGHIRWNPTNPYDTSDQPFKPNADNILQVMADNQSKGWDPGNQIILSCTMDVTFVGPFPRTITGGGPSGTYSLTFSSPTSATITVTGGFSYKSYMNVIFPNGSIQWVSPFGGGITATPNPTFLSNTATLGH